MFGRKEGIMSENDFGVKVLVRDAIRAEERAKGIKICRSAAVMRNGRLYMFDSLEEAKRLYDYEAHR